MVAEIERIVFGPEEVRADYCAPFMAAFRAFRNIRGAIDQKVFREFQERSRACPRSNAPR